MKQKLKFLLDVEIVDDNTIFEPQSNEDSVTYSYQACGGGGGCGGGCGGGRKLPNIKSDQQRS